MLLLPSAALLASALGGRRLVLDLTCMEGWEDEGPEACLREREGKRERVEKGGQRVRQNKRGGGEDKSEEEKGEGR